MAAASESVEPTQKPVRARSLALAMLLLVPVTYACTSAQVSSMFSLLTAPVGATLAVLLINAPLRRWAPRLALHQTDVVVIFAITSVGAAMSSEWAWVTHSSMHMYPILGQTDPTVRDVMLPNLPDWLAVKDVAKVQDITAGGHDLAYAASKLPLFLPRYLGWGALLLSVTFAGFCINSLMRGAWCKTERLSFPLIQLPVAMAEKAGGGGMWRSRQMWSAFAVMFGIDMLNGFNYLFPNLPRIPVKDYVFLNDLLREPPWNQIGLFPIALYPFMSAIAIFMPSDLVFSMVFFFFMRKTAHLLIAGYGVPQGTFSGTFLAPGPPYFDEQTWGGVLALFLGSVWVSRTYLREVWSDIRTGRKPEDGGLTHRWAFIGLMLCFGVVVFYGLLGTLPVTFMVPYVALFLIFSFVLTRIRAQLGPPTHEFAFFGPNSILFRFLGNRWLTDKQMVWVNQVFISMNRIYRTHPMPHQLEAMKMGQLEGVSQKRIFWSTAVAAVVALFLAYFFLHAFAYRTGQYSRWADGLTYLQMMMAGRKGPDVVGMAMTLFGFSTVLLLDAIRFRFPAFPLHPAGYVLSMNFGVDYFWFGLTLATLIKLFVQRYYGLSGYDKLRRVALGILLGEYAAETIWMSTALITHQSTYTISFNERGLGVQ